MAPNLWFGNSLKAHACALQLQGAFEFAELAKQSCGQIRVKCWVDLRVHVLKQLGAIPIRQGLSTLSKSSEALVASLRSQDGASPRSAHGEALQTQPVLTQHVRNFECH